MNAVEATEASSGAVVSEESLFTLVRAQKPSAAIYASSECVGSVLG